MAKRTKYPAVIYVAKEQDNDGTEYLTAYENYSMLAEVEESVECAVYKFVGTSKVTAKAELK